MTPEQAKDSLLKAIKQTQDDIGQKCPPMKGGDKPGLVLEKYDFDSKVWPSTINLISSELKIEIPDNENLFCDKQGMEFYTINEISQALCKFPSKKAEKDNKKADKAS